MFRKKRDILFDFWGTLGYSNVRDSIWQSISNEIKNFDINKKDFFEFWKENWFKSNIVKEEFIHRLCNNFNLNDRFNSLVEKLIDPENVRLYKNRFEKLSELNNRGYNLHLVSDCGRDTKSFVNQSKLDDIFLKKFYSFMNGETKEEGLYSIVKKELGNNNLIIGDDRYRDLKIPKRYGFHSIHIDEEECLDDILTDFTLMMFNI